MPTLVDTMIYHGLTGNFVHTYAEEWAAYKHALAAVAATDPERLGHAHNDPLTLLDEAAVAMASAAWMAGARAGEALGRASLALESEQRICDGCNGEGQERGDPSRACFVCGGRGTVPADQRD